jgi:hypothetical protein
MDFKVRVVARHLPVGVGSTQQTGQHCDTEEND